MSTAMAPQYDILDPGVEDDRLQLIALLTAAYRAEIETVIGYIASSTNPDGIRAQTVRDAIGAEIDEELGHARRLAQRIRELYGAVPGSVEIRHERPQLQTPLDRTNVASVIRGVLEAETEAINLYRVIVGFCDGRDPVTQDMAIAILADEERHRRTFEGFLREYES